MNDDPRVTCNTCANLRGGWCIQAKRAAFVPQRLEIGSTLAATLQHCPAHVQSDLQCTRCGKAGHRASQCKVGI